jgi:hypothetical protein
MTLHTAASQHTSTAPVAVIAHGIPLSDSPAVIGARASTTGIEDTHANLVAWMHGLPVPPAMEDLTNTNGNMAFPLADPVSTGIVTDSIEGDGETRKLTENVCGARTTTSIVGHITTIAVLSCTCMV